MSPPLAILVILIGGIIAAVLAVFLILLTVKFFKGFFRAIGWIISHIFRFITGMISDSFRVIGALFAAIALSLLVMINVVIARWSNASHFGRALKDEFNTASRALYRVCIGHPARFLLLNGLTEGIEVRVVYAIEGAPGSDKPSKRTGEFEGYTIVGSLKGGGSGGKLFVAEPNERKLASFERRGLTDVGQVVIKSFSLKDGSSMPQIVRESRALEAAKKLGLVLEHELSEERFYYVMPYVPGESLGTVTQRLHAESGSGGLNNGHLRYTLGLIAELLNTLNVYHRGGLWHKDIKPDNIIVSGDHATLVDLGLVTPLRSAMTLTTHGTEYFRDPEMVRMALRGAKVHEVDGVKFDIYGAGAVLFSAIENSFPAHGGLSQLSKRCPDALRWIIRRSMADLTQRYASAEDMLADLRVVIEADDPYALKPKDLPSMGGAAPQSLGFNPPQADDPSQQPQQPDWVFADAPEPQRAHAPAAAATRARGKTRFKLQDWLTGRYTVENLPFAPNQPAASGAARAHGAQRSPVPPRHRSPLTAAEQRAAAQARVKAAQQRARERRTARNQKFDTGPNRNMLIGVVIAGAVIIFGGMAILVPSNTTRISMSGSQSSRYVQGHENWTPPRWIGLHTVDTNEATTLWLAEDDSGIILGTKSNGAPVGRAWTRIPDMPGIAYAQLDSEQLRRIASGGVRSGGSVLVIEKLSQQDSDEAREKVEWLTRTLDESGLTLYGPGNSSRDIELIARAEAIVGLTRIMNFDHSRLRSWLGETDDLDGLIWIESARDHMGNAIPNNIRALLVTATGDALGQLRAIEAENAAAGSEPADTAAATG